MDLKKTKAKRARMLRLVKEAVTNAQAHVLRVQEETLAAEIVEQLIVDLHNSTFRDILPNAMEELVKYQIDMEETVQKVLRKYKLEFKA